MLIVRLMDFSASADLMFGFQVFLLSTLFSSKLQEVVGVGLIGSDCLGRIDWKRWLGRIGWKKNEFIGRLRSSRAEKHARNAPKSNQ